MKSSSQNTKILIAVLILASNYAILRYNVFKEVPWIDLPLYVSNKIISFSAIIFISIGRINFIRNDISSHNYFSKAAKVLIFAHIILSLLVFTPEYYPKFFEGLKLNFIGQLSLFFGAMAFIITSYVISSSIEGKLKLSNNIYQKITTAFLIFIALHVFIMGYEGWLNVKSWPGYMPPITLLSFIFSILPFYFKIKCKKVAVKL